MPGPTIVDLLEQDHHWLRADGTLVPLHALDRPEAGAVLSSLEERASLLWFAAMWRADRRYVRPDVAALDVVSPQHWLRARPLVGALRSHLRLTSPLVRPLAAVPA